MTVFLVLLLGQALVGVDASKLTVGEPRTVAVVNVDKIGGEPWRLSWSPSGEQVHLVAMKRKRENAMDLAHHVIDLGSGAMRKVGSEPEWAAEYWTWKAHRSAPDNPAFALELDQQRKNETATARPMGGDLARGGVSTGDPGTTIDQAAGQSSMNVLIITLLLKGEIIGQWKGEPFVPGLTYGWAPSGARAIAFAAQDGRLMLLDEQGRKKKIGTTKDVRLPAWSSDGKQLAWLEKQDRKKFRIQVADIN